MRIALGVEYNGSQFCGWQMQRNGVRTVQQVLENALSIIADEKINIVCAGRTDTGVHATGQVVHFDTQAVRDEKAWVMGVNTHLPYDVASLWCCTVDEDFSARFSATARQYRYVISNRRARPAILNSLVSWRHGVIDEGVMHRAAQALTGAHDFSSFRSAACQADHARRSVHYVNVHRQDDFIFIDIEANAFLHHMVRNIVGSLLMIGQHEQSEDWIAELIKLKDRTQAGPTAPAGGLYMVKVTYPDKYAFPPEIFLPAFKA